MIAAVTSTGVGQRRNGRISNALLKLHARLAKLPGVEALHCKHTDNAIQVASRIAHEIHATHVFLTGHSAGGGHAVDIAHELEAFGVAVDGMVLADPFHKGGVVVPANVRQLWVYRKEHDGPIGGWRIELADAKSTQWWTNEVVRGPHWAVDEYAVEQGVLWRLVTEALAESKAG